MKLLDQSSAYMVLNQTVDSLDVRILYPSPPSQWLKDQVTAWRSFREQFFSEPDLSPLILDLPNLGSFRVLPSALHGREFVLINPEICDIHIWNPENWLKSWPAHGQFLVSFRSKFLQFAELHQVEQVLSFVEDFLCSGETWNLESFFPRYRYVARGDLAVDVRRPDSIKWSDLEKFVCRARCFDGITTAFEKDWSEVVKRAAKGRRPPPKEDNNGGANSQNEKNLSSVEFVAESIMKEWAYKIAQERHMKNAGCLTMVKARRQPETMYFGRFASDLYCCTYNKKLACAVQGKLYLGDVWRLNGWDGSGEVWRTEFRLSGGMLKNCFFGAKGGRDIRELRDFWASIPSLWKYLTSKWLRHVDENPDDPDRIDRWDNSAYWDVVSSPWAGINSDIKRVPKLRNPKQDQLHAQIMGCALTYAANDARHDFDLDGIKSLILDLQIFAADPSSCYKLQARRRLFGKDDQSDAAITHLLRRERMREGAGS